MVGSKAREVRKAVSRLVFVLLADFQHAGVTEKMSVVYETECRHAAVQRGKQDQNIYSTETHTSEFILNDWIYRSSEPNWREVSTLFSAAVAGIGDITDYCSSYARDRGLHMAHAASA